MGDEGTVAHVSFLDLMTRLDAYQLRHETIHDIRIILGLISLRIRQQSQVDKFLVSHVIQSKEVSTRLLDGIAISLERIRVCAGQELAGAMTQTLVEVRMEVITAIAILFDQSQCVGIDDKLLLEARTLSSLVIGIGDIRDGNALRAMSSPYPVCIGQVDANSGRGIFIASQHGRTDGVGHHPLNLWFPETRINRRMILKPLGMA